MAPKTLTIYCDCAYYNLVQPDMKSKALDAIRAGGEVEAVPDLCRLCAERDARLKDWAKADSLRIFACYPRAVKWLFHAGGAPLRDEGVEFINMRTGDLESQISNFKLEIGDSKPQDEELHLKSEISNLKSEVRAGDLPRRAGGPAATSGRAHVGGTAGWIPWFPVIDYDRCQNCKQCYGFCLFGVYQLCDGDRVEVRNPAHCKTNCPACAKACPHGAIIFPKYAQGPINGDEPLTPAPEEKDKADLADVLGGNIYDTIRKRGKRFSGNTSQGPSVMKELREKLDIPADVLASMTPAELAGIKKKAEKKSANAKHISGESDNNE